MYKEDSSKWETFPSDGRPVGEGRLEFVAQYAVQGININITLRRVEE
jgi:hypothetical protein